MVIKENIKTAEFRELVDGDIFRYGSIYYLKVPPCSTNKYNYNSYDLVNNDYCYFSDYRDIIPVKCKLIIE